MRVLQGSSVTQLSKHLRISISFLRVLVLESLDLVLWFSVLISLEVEGCKMTFSCLHVLYSIGTRDGYCRKDGIGCGIECGPGNLGFNFEVLGC